MLGQKFKERQIEIFRAVMATGSLTAAAAHLGVSQPSLSMSLKRFEDQLGTPLFSRIAGRMVPTDEAKLIFVEVERVYGQFDLLSDAIYAIARGDQSSLRFGTTPSIAVKLLPKALKMLRDLHPKKVFVCDTISQRDIRDYLIFGQGACVSSIARLDDPTIEAQQLGHGRLVCIVPKGHALAQRSSVRPSDLDGHPLISFRPGTTHGMYIDETFARDGVERKTVVYIHFVEAALAYVREGIGIAIIDQFSAIECESSGLVSIPLEKSVEIPMFMYHYKFKPKSLAVDELADGLTMLLKKYVPQNNRDML